MLAAPGWVRPVLPLEHPVIGERVAVQLARYLTLQLVNVKPNVAGPPDSVASHRLGPLLVEKREMVKQDKLSDHVALENAKGSLQLTPTHIVH